MKRLRTSTFAKLTTLLAVLVIPIILLYAYSHQVSINVVRSAVEEGQRNRLTFFMSQMDNMIDQLTKYSVIASNDDGIKSYLTEYSRSTLMERIDSQQRITDMLNMQIATSSWDSQILMYLMQHQELLTTDLSARYDAEYLAHAHEQSWSYHRDSRGQSFFSWMRTSASSQDLIVEVRFTDQNLVNMLNRLKQDGDSEPFLYASDGTVITNSTSVEETIQMAAGILNEMQLGEEGSRIVQSGQGKYVMNYVLSSSLGWYLVDFVRLDSVYSPITLSSTLFYISVSLLLVLVLLLTLLLYRNVQRPISRLLHAVRRIRDGQYMTRLKDPPKNEFMYLFHSFNNMAEQIEELIERVYKESLRSKEATLKQLQSQINPHFLYNCLFYIKNMANLGEKEAVVAMALNLGEYYRYTTRLEKPTAPLEEEVKLVDNYLTIQMLRLQRLTFEIEFPERMMQLEIPRLLLQPIVENAVIHGVEDQLDFAMIHISGETEGSRCRIRIDNNGQGMDVGIIDKLKRQVEEPLNESGGFGLWNIHQRLITRYGKHAGLTFSESPSGGLRVELCWEDPSRARGDDVVYIADR
ncbi:histidine kinase [Paenibacillus sp. MDMC362]|uniref:sensor histidine kinase n=1 Tax=Paenibacillus sp. MDMC362 TaxID=2977365 RepID=UPI000DC3494D|nr:histidine kinase [Paenibacillus sp. MDMC362]RAR43247.1 two-component sensor histidine kinase [Paenibacillus sp. MDMC362]